MRRNPIALMTLGLLIVGGCEEPYQSGSGGGGNNNAPQTRQPTNLTQGSGPVVGAQAYQVDVTGDLPVPFDRAAAKGLTIGGGIKEGRADIGAAAANPASNAVTAVQPPEGKAVVRIEVDRDQAKSTLGRARTLAAGVTAMMLTTDSGDHYNPNGYVWVHANGSQEISVDPLLGQVHGMEVPTRQMQAGDRMLLYFFVEPGVTLKSFQYGDSKQMISGVTVPK